MTVPSANAWDVVIAGGGLSGLALAAELSQPEFAHLKIAVLESRSSYTRDKTWSYWDTAQALPPLWSRLAQYRWNQWEVSLGERRHTLTSTTAYASLPSDAFYSLALSHISRAKHVQLLMNQQVRQVQSEPSGVRIDRTNAEALYGHWLAG